MSQSFKHSTIETTLNIGSGFLLSLAVWHWLAIPLIDVMGGNLKDFNVNFAITSLFTVTSFARSFAWRRFFNYIQYKRVLN